jgi:hypothetical protein
LTASAIMAAMAYPGMRPPPTIDPREVRPSRGWYWFAGVLGLLSCLAGPVLILIILLTADSLVKDFDVIGTEFDTDAPVTVQLTQDKTWAIYVEAPQQFVDPSASPGGTPTPTPTPSATPAPPASRCTATPVDGGTVDLAEITYSATVGQGGRSWRQLYRMTVTQDGQYRVDCEPTDPTAGTAHYAVGEDPNIAGIFGKMFAILGSSFGAFLIPCVGLVIAGLIALIVGLRRSSNRRLLQRQRLGY